MQDQLIEGIEKFNNLMYGIALVLLLTSLPFVLIKIGIFVLGN